MRHASISPAALAAGGAIARLAACPIGPRILFKQDDGGGSGGADILKELRELGEAINAKQKETSEAIQKQREEVAAVGKTTDETNRKLQELGTENTQLRARLLEIEQKLARSPGGDPRPEAKSWGEQTIDSDELKDFFKRGARGSARVPVKQRDPYGQKAITNLGSLVPIDRRPGIIQLPRRRFTIRQLLAPGTTTSNAIEYLKETAFVNNAAPVAEAALKPESNITYAAATANVRTIAHFILVSRQSMDDMPALRAQIDGRLRYGLEFVEEVQLLTGDGTGQNLNGLIPQATAYETARNASGETRADIISHALQQADDAGYPADGVVLNGRDWERIRLQKNTTGDYLGAGPFAPQDAPTIWGVPVVATPAIPQGSFLAGAFFMSAQIFDRMDAEVLVSSEDSDNFRKNMLTVRAEERLTQAVYTPAGLVYGSFGTVPVP